MFEILNNFFKINKTILNLLSLRQESVVSNIANSKTPNYNKKDINFKKTIKKLLPKNSNKELVITSNKHIPNKSSISQKRNFVNVVNYTNKIQSYKKINLEKERMNFVTGNLMCQYNIFLLKKELINIYTAIRGS
ncbi:hypothetical protein RJD23_01135 [Buchnera aphidicola (Ceratoglyphina bambusae)]|uniref:flagellar basal body rod protein FlgB n=1 Tax=Buchnera aphidicola TaxID=9 RepID=UPI0031B7F286